LRYLVDANVLSATRSGRARQPEVVDWFRAQAQGDLATSAIVIGELLRGAHLVARSDPAQAAALFAWIAGVRESFANTILPIDITVTQVWARLSVPNPLPRHDGLIAATALRHGLTVVTRNVRDFEPWAVPVLNPFSPV
jgi:predicted nucleic acid-binding protein